MSTAISNHNKVSNFLKNENICMFLPIIWKKLSSPVKKCPKFGGDTLAAPFFKLGGGGTCPEKSDLPSFTNSAEYK